MGCGPSSKPATPESLLPLPSGDDRPHFKMTRGSSQPGWEVKNTDDQLWMWLDDANGNGTLEDFEGNNLGSYYLDSDGEFDVKKKCDWPKGEDSDSSDSDDSGDGDDATVKLKWKADRKVKFSVRGEEVGKIKMKIKGKSQVGINFDEEAKRHRVGFVESQTKKAKYKFEWRGEDRKWSVGDTNGEFSIPDSLSFNTQAYCCSMEMDVSTHGGLIAPQLVPLLAGACHDHVHQDRIEATMASRCRNEGDRLASELDRQADIELS